MKWHEILQVPVTPLPKEKKKEKQITFCLTDRYLIMDIWRKKVNVCRHAIDRKTWEYGTYHPDAGIKDKTNLTNCTEGFGGKYWATEPHQKDWLTEKQIKELDKITKDGHDWIGDVLERICRMETYYRQIKGNVPRTGRNSGSETLWVNAPIRVRRYMTGSPRDWWETSSMPFITSRTRPAIVRPAMEISGKRQQVSR